MGSKTFSVLSSDR